MTKKENNSISGDDSVDFKKLSIQVGLNGLSFCILDTISLQVIDSSKIEFRAPSTPYLVKKELQTLIEDKEVQKHSFSDISVVHKNNLFSLVPKDLFHENELPNYLKLNTKLLSSDHIAYDEIPNIDIINVYVPLVNVNNYLFDLFGSFEFKHSGTVLIQNLITQKSSPKEPICYVYVTERAIEIVILNQKRLMLYNHFEFKTKADFLYYILFAYEQLGLSPESTALKMFGAIEEGDEIYELCYEYISHVSVYAPSSLSYAMDSVDKESIDLTILSAL